MYLTITIIIILLVCLLIVYKHRTFSYGTDNEKEEQVIYINVGEPHQQNADLIVYYDLFINGSVSRKGFNVLHVNRNGLPP